MDRTSTTTVFWPLDVVHDGYIYGWTEPSMLCIAGVLDTDTCKEAKKILQEALRSPDINNLSSSCGTPLILGHCTIRSLGPPAIPEIKVDSVVSILTQPYRLIHYHRHAPKSQRFYMVDNTLHSTSGTRAVSLEAALVHDFTRCKSSSLHSVEDRVMVNRWNSARLLQDAIERRQTEKTGSSLNDQRRSERAAGWYRYSSLFMLEDKIKSSTPVVFSVLSILREYSFAARQVEERTRVLYDLLWRTPSPRAADTRRCFQQYNEYYNNLWVVLNDVIIGLAFRQFMLRNREVLGVMVADVVSNGLAHRIQRVVLWLDSWPAGLKLNTELSRFYSHGFIGLITQWTKLLHCSLSFLPSFILVVEGTGIMGMTMILSLSLDILSALTVHLYACYLVSSTTYRQILMLIGSLWNLFRGKRYNVLRNRTDPWGYDVDQLLLGTILFTLAAHLFPTVLVYYAVFALVRLSLIVLYASCECLLAFMNHFPLFKLMLRSKDPQRLPGDIYLRVNSTPGGCSVIAESHPLPLDVVFDQYAGLWHRLSHHYHPIRLCRRLVLGQVLDTSPHTNHASTDEAR